MAPTSIESSGQTRDRQIRVLFSLSPVDQILLEFSLFLISLIDMVVSSAKLVIYVTGVVVLEMGSCKGGDFQE